MSILSTLRDLRAGKPLARRSSHWPKLRAEWLKQYPACAACGGDKHLEVHHKHPVHLFPGEELVWSNLMTLCETPSFSCHLKVGHCGNWKLYRKKVIDAAAMVYEGLREP